MRQVSNECRKCGHSPRRLLQVRVHLAQRLVSPDHSTPCRECFFPLISTKFRRTLEPSINAIPDGPRKKGLKPTGNLCLGFSGGLGSTVLLDLVSQSYFSTRESDNTMKDERGGRDHPRNASVWKKATVCYVEICNALPGVRYILVGFPGF